MKFLSDVDHRHKVQSHYVSNIIRKPAVTNMSTLRKFEVIDLYDKYKVHRICCNATVRKQNCAYNKSALVILVNM